MGQYVITIMGTGPHHNFKEEERDGWAGKGMYLVPDGKGGFIRKHDADADALATDLVEVLRKHGHSIEHASFTVGGRNSLLPDVSASYEAGIFMPGGAMAAE
jgi:hypothetical protein